MPSPTDKKSRAEIDAHRRGLLNALINLDLAWARKNALFHITADHPAPTDEVLLNAMHKARYEHADVPPNLRHESRAWLVARGSFRSRRAPWPPEGMLPS